MWKWLFFGFFDVGLMLAAARTKLLKIELVGVLPTQVAMSVIVVSLANAALETN
jgi:hypothetical protein